MNLKGKLILILLICQLVFFIELDSKSISKSHYNGMKNTYRNRLRMSIMDKMNFLKNKAMMEFKELEAYQFSMKRWKIL